MRKGGGRQPRRLGARRRALLCVVVVSVAALAVVAPNGTGARANRPKEAITLSASSVTSVPADVTQVPVGVGSPPLRGTLTLPAGAGPFPAVVLVSGSGPNDQNETVGPNHPFLDLAVGLGEHGIASVRYDKRTLDYPSSIDPETFTPTDEYVPDALAAMTVLRAQPQVNPHLIFVLGHSQGGTYAPLIAQRAPTVAGVILLAASTESLGHAILRQTRYLATLPGPIGASAMAQLTQVIQIAAAIDSVTALEKDSPSTPLYGGVGPAYYLSELRYHEVAVARSLTQPILILQGDRDYQVTVHDDLDVWRRGLHGKDDVTVAQFAHADHLFLDGTGRPTPAEYETVGQVDPAVITTIARWIEAIARTDGKKR